MKQNTKQVELDKWIYHEDDERWYECPFCGGSVYVSSGTITKYKYCPYCGERVYCP